MRATAQVEASVSVRQRPGENVMKSGLVAAIVAGGMLVAGGALAQDGTLKKIKETGAITIGYRDSSIPFSYLDDAQKPIGFALDVCARIVDAVKADLKLPNLEVKYNPVTSATRIPLIANGTVDLECGSTTNNPDRQKQVAFTNTHYLTASRFVVKKDSRIATIEGLKGKTVVSTSGSTNIKQLNDVNNERKLGINVIPAKDHAEAFLMVETDRATAFVMDDILLSSLIASSKNPAAYVIPDEAFSKPEPYGIMLPRNDAAFKKVVDGATSALYRSPEIQAIYRKWFLSPIPPKNLNLNVPLGDALAKNFGTPTDSGDPAVY